MFIVKVPFINGLGKTQGCEKAGNLILKPFIEDSKEKIRVEEIPIENSDIELSYRIIKKNSFDIFEKEPKTVFLGGDHSISAPLVEGFLKSSYENNKEPCLIVFDAHADCDFANKEPTHEEWLRKVIEETNLNPQNIMLIGSRKLWENEKEFLKEKKVNLISMDNFLEDISDSCDIVMEFVQGKDAYVSIDIDVVDPAFAPGTGYKEPGGFSSQEILYIIKRLNRIKNLRAVDIVEINPLKDNDSLTINLGSEILKKCLKKDIFC